MNRNRVVTAYVAAVLAVLLGGCARSGPVLLQDVLYQAPTGTIATPAPGRTVVGLGPFKDLRGGQSSVLGVRTIGDDIRNDLVIQGTVADLVTAALKDALASRGITVKDMPAWDLENGPGRTEGVDLFLGGEIKTFWVEAASRPLNVRTKATVLLRAAAAEAAGGKPFRTVNLNSALSREDVVFSFATVQATLSEALTAALDQLLADEEIRKRIHP